jgi:hypothetical protein
MAYINTYTFKYSSSANIKYTLEFWDQGANASTWADTKGTLGSKNCVINFGSENAKMYSPLKPSTLTIDFMVTDVLDANYLKQLRDNRQERDVYVYLYNTGTSSVKIEGDSPIFAGYLLMDLAEDPDISIPFPMKLRAIDGLASLKYYDFIPHNKAQRPDHLYPYPDTWKPGNTNTFDKFYPFRQWISRILRYTGYATTAAGCETDAEFQISVNWFNGNMPNLTGDPLDWTRATADQFYTAEGDTGNIRYKPLTCYDALQFICKTWGMRCFAYKNTFYFIGINTYTDDNTGTLAAPVNINYHRYTITGSTATPATGVSLDLEWGRYFAPVFLKEANQKLAGSQYGVLPAFKRVSVDFLNISNINYFQGFPIMPQPWPISTGSGSLRVEEPIGTFDFDGTNSQSFFQEIYLNFQNSSGGNVKYGIRWHIIAKKVGTNTEYQYGYPNWSNSNLMPEWFSMSNVPQNTSVFSRGHLIIPPGPSSFNVITDLQNPAWFGNSINMYVTCPPTVFTAGDWEFKYVTVTEWFSGSQNIAYGHGRCDPLPNPGTSYNTDPDSNFITYTDSTITQGVGSSFFSPIANGIIGTEETSTQIVQTGLDTDFEEVTDVLWGDLPGGGAGRLQVYNGTGWVPSGFQGYWGIDSLAGNNSLAETLCEEIFKRQAQNVRKFSTKINLDAKNYYNSDSTGDVPMYGTPFTRWFTPSHAGSATTSANWIMHTGSFDTGADTWSFSLYEFKTFIKGITTTTTGTNGSNSGGVGNDNTTGSLVPSGSAGGVGKTLANPARNNSRAIAKLMQNATRPLTIITGNQGLSAEGTLTVTSLTVQAIPNAVLKAGDTILVMCQYQPEATASLDETNTIEYGNVEFVLSSDQSAGATTLSVVSKTIYQTITKGDVVTISQPDLMAQYQNKTKGSIASLPVTATTIGSATDAIYIQNGSTELLVNGDFDADTNWTKSTGWTISGGKANRNGTGISNSPISQSIGIVNGKTYNFSYTRTYISGGGVTNIFVKLDNVNYSTLGQYSSTIAQTHTVTGTFTAGFTGNMTWAIYGIGTFTGSLDNASVTVSLNGVGIGNSTPSTPLDVTGTVNATTFTGDLNGTINTATTGTTQSANNNSTKIATTAYVDAATASVPKGLQYQGTWNAATNTPTIVSGTGVVGYYYIVATAGTTTIDGISEWAVGDWIIFTDHTTDHWQKIDQSESDTLQSVTTRGATTTDSITVAGLTTGGNITVSGTVDGRNVSTDGSQLDSNTSNIASNTSSISTNTSNISTNTSSISTNTGNITTNATAISGKVSKSGDIMTGNLVIDNATLTLDPDSPGTVLNWKESDSNTLAGQLRSYSNRGDIYLYYNGTKKTEITSSTGSFIPDLKIGAATGITSEKLEVTGNIAVTGTVDGVDIAARDAVLTSTTSTANTNASNVAANTTDIATNTSAIATKASASSVSTNTTNIATNTSNISTNASDISTNTSAIATKASASSVTTNTTNIATNATDISTNATAITGKVSLTGNETIAGTKSFSSIINANEGINIVGGSIGSGKIILHTNNLMYIRGGSAGLMLQNGDGSAAHQLTSAGNHIFEASGEKMRLVTGGQLLIGHSASYYAGTKLQVGNTTDSQNGLQITTSTSGYGYVLFGDGTGADAYVGQIAYKHSDNTMRFRANATESFIIKNTGIDIAGNIVITGTVDGRDVSNDGTQLDTNTSAISTNTGNISTNTTNIATNTSAIATKASATSVTTNTANIATNTSNISSNDTDIATNVTNITSNASNIQTNATNISSNNTDITTNASNISTNTSNISTNTGNITSNTNAIATKASSSSVATNTTNIATNTSNITTNTNNIAGKVSKSGDTMTGLLTGTTATFTSTVNLQGILKLGSSTSSGIISSNTDQNIFIKPAGSGNLYLGDSGEGFNIYHYNSGEDGTYAIYDFNANYYRIRTTQVNGVWINDTLKITGAVTVDSTVDGVDIAARDAVLTSTTSTATTNASNIQTNTTNIAANSSDIGTNNTIANAALPKAGGIITGNVTFNDNKKAIFGTSNDGLNIYHNGSNSFIQDTGTGYLALLGSQIKLQSDTEETMLLATPNAGVTLYYDTAAKLATTSTGVLVTGELEATSLDINGNADISGTLDVSGNVDIGSTQIQGSLTTTGNITISKSDPTLILEDTSGSDNQSRIWLRENSNYGWYMDYQSNSSDFFKLNIIDANVGNTNPITALTINRNTNATFAGNVDIEGSLSITADGSNAVTFTESSAGILTIATPDDFIVDAGGDIALDAGGNDIRLKAAGTTFGKFTNSSNHFLISSASNQDIILQASGTGDIRFKADDGAGTATAYFRLDASDVNTRFYKDVKFSDNVKALFGGSGDLEIYHDSNHSYIADTGTGNLQILATNFQLNNSANSQNMITATDGGAVTLFTAGSAKLATTSTGVTITGSLTSDTAIYAPIYYDSNNSGFYLDPLGTSNLNTLQTGSITASGDIVAPGIYVGSANTSYDFYNNGTTYLNGAVTVDDNIDITGNITVTGTVDGVDVAAIAVLANAALPNTGGTINGNLVISGVTDQILILKSTDDGPIYQAYYRDSDRHAYLGFGGSSDKFTLMNEESGGSIELGTNSTAALTIDSSQNATFANSVILPNTKIIKFKNSVGNAVEAITFNSSNELVICNGNSANGSILFKDGGVGGFTNLTIDGLNNKLIVAGELEATTLDINGNADISGNLTGVNNLYTDKVYINSLQTLATSSNFLYIDPNTSFSSGIYINNQVFVDGGLIGSYNENLQLKTSGTTRLTLSNSDGSATFAGDVTAGNLIPSADGTKNLGNSSYRWGNLELKSGGQIQWQNGDARIIEGLVNNYSLSLQTYDGSALSTALRLDGDNTATFAGKATFAGDLSVGTTSTGVKLLVSGTGWDSEGIKIHSSTSSGAVLTLQNTTRQFQIASRSNSFDIRDVTDNDTSRFNINSTGNATFTGTVNGRNITDDGTQLDTNTTNISSNATQIQTNSTALAAKAPIASPTFTGSPAAPTAPAGTNNTKIATTAFVTAAVSAGGGGTVNRGSFAPSAVQSIGSGGVTGTKSTLTFNTSKITAVGMSVAATGLVNIDDSGDYMINLNFGTESYLTQNRILGAAQIQYSADGEEWVDIDGSKIYTYNRGIATGEGASTWGTIYEGSGHSSIIHTVADESYIRVQFWVDGRSSSSTGMRTVLDSCRLSIHKLA